MIKKCSIQIYQPNLDVRLKNTFDAKNLDGFVKWTRMDARDYVLGLKC